MPGGNPCFFGLTCRADEDDGDEDDSEDEVDRRLREEVARGLLGR